MDRQEYQREYRRKHKEKAQQYQRDYYQKNKDRINKRTRQWNIDHPDVVSNNKQKWREANKDKIKAKRKEWKSTLRGRLSHKIFHLKKQKRNKSLVIEIDGDFLMELWQKQSGRCAITGYEMSYSTDTLYSVSVDRIDSAKGYTKDNVQLVCVAINFAKNKYDNNDIIEFWDRGHK